MNAFKTLSTAEAANYLKCHKDTILELVKSGELPAAKIGRSHVFVVSDLVNFIRSKYFQRNPFDINTRESSPCLLSNEDSFITPISTLRESATARARAQLKSLKPNKSKPG
ncbi:helix-turn-helix domain-containing protein [Pleionea sediminis]|uniref:helix-turn-helix domain-containing protein n=1 Tax=Pleionea sediminis TaxID=2569479 RepID=UPI001186036E